MALQAELVPSVAGVSLRSVQSLVSQSPTQDRRLCVLGVAKEVYLQAGPPAGMRPRLPSMSFKVAGPKGSKAHSEWFIVSFQPTAHEGSVVRLLYC